MCPVPGRLGFWLSHPMVHRGVPGSPRCLASPSSCTCGHYTKRRFRGATGGYSPMWSADAVSERGSDTVALCHLTVISHWSRHHFSLSYLHVARYPCPSVARVASSEHPADLLKLV